MAVWHLISMIFAPFFVSPLHAAGPIYGLLLQPPVIVQTASLTAVNTIPIAATGTGNLLVMGVIVNNATTVSTVKDNLGNSFTSAGVRCTSSGAVAAEIWYLLNSTAGATSITLTFISGMSTVDMFLAEVRGIKASAALDGTNSVTAPASTSSPNAPTVTTTFSHDAVFSLIGNANAVTAVSAPFTNMTLANGNVMSYDLTATKGTYGASWTLSAFSTWCGGTVAFKGLW